MLANALGRRDSKAIVTARVTTITYDLYLQYHIQPLKWGHVERKG